MLTEDLDVVQERFLRGLASLNHEKPNTESTTPSLPRLSDVGNGELFAHLHRQHARYCYPMRSWFVCNPEGRWERDPGNHIMRLAKDTVLHLYELAQRESDDQRRTQLAVHALRTENAHRLQAMVDLAKDEMGMAIEPQAFDANLMLFNVSNGVLDLKTGECRPRQPEDFITKQSPVIFDPNATCPEWLRFLARIFQDDQRLIDYLQQVIGYCLTGLTVEQVFFLLWGSGANGKSTLMKVLLKSFGDYGLQVPAETFLTRHQDGRATPDLVRLQGARLAVASESDDGARLAESLIKQMTGSDRIAARRLYQDFIEFEPTHKIILATNHKPRVKDNSHAMWRRMRLIPFAVQIPDHEQDPALAQKLFAELPGILNWVVAGCLAWQRAGRLETPEQVTVATKAYREEQDVLDDYLRERCVSAPDLSVRFSDLRKDYVEWADGLSERPLSGKAFASALQDRGFTPNLIKNSRHYLGLRLRTMTDELGEAQLAYTGGTADVDLDV